MRPRYTCILWALKLRQERVPVIVVPLSIGTHAGRIEDARASKSSANGSTRDAIAQLLRDLNITTEAYRCS